MSALTIEVDFSLGATITACGPSSDALSGPAPTIGTNITGTIATIGMIDAQGIDASSGFVYLWCSAE
jgi:hypothetical protein